MKKGKDALIPTKRGKVIKDKKKTYNHKGEQSKKKKGVSIHA